MQLTVRMPDEYQSKLNELTREMGLKRSDIVRMALRQFIEENLKRKSITPFEKVSTLIGTKDDGPGGSLSQTEVESAQSRPQDFPLPVKRTDYR